MAEDEIAEGMKASRFAEFHARTLHEIREGYKESLANIFEGGRMFATPKDMQTEVERIGAKLAVMSDFVNELGQKIANGQFASGTQDDEQ